MSESWTRHGGGLAEARAHFGEGPWIDLSTGINPHSWPGVASLDIDWRRLPEEPALAALEAAAADYFGIDPATVCAVPGSEIGLRLVAELLPGRAAHAAPGYRTHGEIFADSMAVSVNRLAEADGLTLLLANPNNPDGHLLKREELHAMLGRRRDGWLLVDEAFADADPRESLAEAVGEDRLVIFRSFGKFFGLAGVRLGFVLGPPELLARLRGRLGAWPLSAAAIAIGTAAYRDRAWTAAMRAQLREEATALDAMLGRCGLTAIGASPLFRLIKIDDAGALFETLCRHHILTRPFDYDCRWLRIGLPADAASRERLEAGLRG